MVQMCQVLPGLMRQVHEMQSTILIKDGMFAASDKLNGPWTMSGESLASRK